MGPRIAARTATHALARVTALVALAATPALVPTPAPVEASRTPGPQVAILTGPGDRTASTTADLTFESDQPGTEYAVRLDGHAWSGWTVRTDARFAGLPGGRHRVSVHARSRTGEVGETRTSSFVVDLAPPRTRFTGTYAASTVLDRSQALEFASSEAGSTFACSIDHHRFRPCDSPYTLDGLRPGQHDVAVRATDPAGRVDPSSAERTLTLVDDAPPASLFTDGFEAGDLNRWSVTTRGGATAGTQGTSVRNGARAATFTSGAGTDSTAFARTRLAAGAPDVTAAAAVRVDAEGVAGENVPLLRLLDDSGGRLVSVYRRNGSGQVWVQYGGAYEKTSVALPLGVWADLSVRAAGSVVQVTWNGVPVHRSTTASLPASRSLQIGNDARAQAGVLEVDDVLVTDPAGGHARAPDTAITSTPSGTTPGSTASVAFRATDAGSLQCSLDQAPFAPCVSPQHYSGLANGTHTFAVRAIDTSGNVDGSPATSSWTSAGASTPALLLSDNQNRRLLITDYNGKVLWKFDNPTRETSSSSGPLGVRWLPNGHILATFGTGKVGEIDPATKTFVWKVAGFNGDWFASPYDAQLLPNGRLAVANARQETGRVTVYDTATGAQVWKYPVNFARLVELVPAGRGTGTTRPTLLMAGRDKLTEAVYAPGQPENKTVTWRWAAGSNTHRAILDRDGHSLVISDWNSLAKVSRPTQALAWSRPQGNTSGEEMRGVAMTATGYVYGYRIWYGASQLRFADANGRLLRSWTSLSDGTRLNLVWGVRTISWPG